MPESTEICHHVGKYSSITVIKNVNVNMRELLRA